MDASMLTVIDGFLKGGGSIQTAATAVALWILWKQIQAHAAERDSWTKRFDSLVQEQNQALDRNSKALSDLQIMIASMTEKRRARSAHRSEA